MRTVLLRLALLSNGSVARMDANSGGGSTRYYSDRIPQHGEPRGQLDLLEQRYVPHLYYGTWWAAAVGAERELVLERAELYLDRALISRGGPPSQVETKAERDARIVSYGEGLPAREVAIAARCGLRDVHAARRDAGRDEEWGRPIRPAQGLTAEERRRRVNELADEARLNARQIARALGVPYSTVLRDLGRKG
jgi:hypothetical protein